MPEVSSITVVEKSKDVIDLVKPKFKHPKLTIIEADIFEWKPAKQLKFDTIYFDIWTDISTDNLEQIRKLHNRFKFHLNRENPNHYMNSWMKEFLQHRKRQETRSYY